MINKKSAISLAITTALAATQTAIADDHRWELTGGLGYQWFDSDRSVDNTDTFHLGVGYVLNSQWTIEAMAHQFSTETDTGNIDIDGDYLHLDALYHFDKQGNWQPYAVIGAGRAEYDPDLSSEFDETLINAGLGVKHAFANSWVARGDIRLLNSLDEEDIDYAVNLSLSYLFGKKAAAPQAAAPADADNDGVIDSQDQCPNTPAGVQVNASGCPLDSDGDGVYDYQDNCPGTASNLVVDSKGCPKTLSETVTIELEVNFASDSAVVREQDYDEIKDLADFMNQYQNTSVVVEGHTDSSGAASYNQGLSQRRADAVRNVLINTMGIAANRVSAIGYGESQPVADNATSEGRLKNRRVIAKVSSEQTKAITK